jgi:hypothetical protein
MAADLYLREVDVLRFEVRCMRVVAVLALRGRRGACVPQAPASHSRSC